MDYSIKELRDRNGISTGELAKRLDIGEDEVRAWEDGKLTPSDDQVTKLADIFAIQPSEIVAGSQAMPQS